MFHVALATPRNKTHAQVYSSAAYDRNPTVANWSFVNPACNERTQGFIVNEVRLASSLLKTSITGYDGRVVLCCSR